MSLCCAVLARRLLLGVSARELHVAKQRVDRLTHGLPGADVAAMLEEDPSLLFEELDTSEWVVLVRLAFAWSVSATIALLPTLTEFSSCGDVCPHRVWCCTACLDIPSACCCVSCCFMCIIS